MMTDTVTEGHTMLAAPISGNTAGPAPRARVFYNRAMQCNRDITVLFARARARDGWVFLDALAGTGAKGIRVAAESGVDLETHLNDMDPGAHAAILRNIELNHLENAYASNMEFNALLSSRGYDWIEIDPYGSPIGFVDLAVRRLSRGGILSVTATDTAALCGTRPDTCRRRYMAEPLATGCRHELGLRILVGAIVRRAAVFDMGLEPLLAYHHGHYFRAFLRKRKGARWADASLENVGYVTWTPGEGYGLAGTHPGTGRFAGPLWTGDLWDSEVIRDMLAVAGDEALHPDTLPLLTAISAELTQPPYHYHMDEMARLTGSRPLKTDALVAALRDAGFEASGVHYSRKGFRTDAGFGDLREFFRPDG